MKKTRKRIKHVGYALNYIKYVGKIYKTHSPKYVESAFIENQPYFQDTCHI